jgi:glutamine synthetase
VSATDLVALVCCDLGAIVRGRALPACDLDAHLAAGVGWVPANHALTPLGPLAEPNPFGCTGDLRLLPDVHTRVCVESGAGDSALELVLCDIVQTDGAPWECCPRTFLRDALTELRDELGLDLVASFEHEFQLLPDPATPPAPDGPLPPAPPPAPFSLEAQRRAEPFAAEVMGALAEAGVQPERFFAEFASHQFEIPVQPAAGVAAADRAVVLREVVREVARRRGLHATFTPLLSPAEAGNGVHVHLTLRDQAGRAVLYDPTRPGCLSELGGQFAAGILLHARALTAMTAPSPVSATRLAPHHWSAGAVCLGQRNREALLRIPPLVSLGKAGRSEIPSRRRCRRQPLPGPGGDRPRGPRRCTCRAGRPADPRPRPGAARSRRCGALPRRRFAGLAAGGVRRARQRRRCARVDAAAVA